jgi:hypothetical protein
MLRPLRRRNLGHAEHRRLHREAADKIDALLAYATPDPEPSDPAGNGGAGPTH